VDPETQVPEMLVVAVVIGVVVITGAAVVVPTVPPERLASLQTAVDRHPPTV